MPNKLQVWMDPASFVRLKQRNHCMTPLLGKQSAPWIDVVDQPTWYLCLVMRYDRFSVKGSTKITCNCSTKIACNSFVNVSVPVPDTASVIKPLGLLNVNEPIHTVSYWPAFHSRYRALVFRIWIFPSRRSEHPLRTRSSVLLRLLFLCNVINKHLTGITVLTFTA